MAKILKLPPHEAQKIAAGEVVERPANVVKELFENSIDAGATQITLMIEDGGKHTIRVIDNGCGISPEDAPNVVEHHATSKIKTVDDLETIATFGFRGEALSSIASVSTISLVTKEEHADEGLHLEIAAGTITKQQATCTPTGTDITISNIFEYVPARKKFLKKRETEFHHIQRLVNGFCLAYPELHIKFFSEGNLLLNCPPAKNLIDRTHQVWEHQGAGHMINLSDYNHDGIHITGVISDHQYARYDRTNILFFVNKRLVKNQHLARAITKGYLNVLPPGRFPATCIHITVDQGTLDVNIHPRKEEVQFLHPRKIETALQKIIKQAIEDNLSQSLMHTAPVSSATKFETINEDIPFIDQPPFIEPAHAYTAPSAQTTTLLRQTPQTPPRAPAFSSHESTPDSQATIFVPQTPPEPTITSKKEATPTNNNYVILGQYKKTYILLDQPDGIYLIDQHAAHERILYELFSQRFKDVVTVTLMFPQVITLPVDALERLEPHLEIFTKNGIEISRFGEQQLRITATPVHLKQIDYTDLLHTVLGWIDEFQSLDHQDFFKKINEKMHAQMACKAAIKAGDDLTHEQMIALLEDLAKTESRFACPHGRPTGWLLSTYEIEKRFKRKA